MLTLASGRQIGQSRSIQRLVARHTGLYPEDPLDASDVDGLMDALDDFQSAVNATGRGLEGEEKNAARKKGIETEGENTHTKLSKIEANCGADGFAVGGKLTIADLHLAATTTLIISGFFDGIPKTALDKFPNVLAIRKNVASNPNVAKYLSETVGEHPMYQNLRDAGKA